MHLYLVLYKLSYDSDYYSKIIQTKEPLYGVFVGGDSNYHDVVDNEKLLIRDHQICKQLDEDDDFASNEYHMEIKCLNSIPPIDITIDPDYVIPSSDDGW